MTSILNPAFSEALDATTDDDDNEPSVRVTLTVGSDKVTLSVRQVVDLLEQLRPIMSPDEVDASMSSAYPPHGCFLAYSPFGDILEWTLDGTSDLVYPTIVLRGRDMIETFRYRFYDMVWREDHQDLLHLIETHKVAPTREQAECLEQRNEEAKAIEARYGQESLGQDAFEFGVLCGKLAALNWVLGDEWEESLDI